MIPISVIVPAYNEERFLPRSLSSLLHSGIGLADAFPGSEYELIVVDNGSADATAAVARDYGATVVTERRRNVACARNRGAATARGELLAFVDADYRVPLSFLAEAVRQFRADPALTAAGVRVVLEPSEIDPLTRSNVRVALFTLRRLANMSFGVFVLRRDYFSRLHGFDEGTYAYEDIELLDRIKRDQRAGSACYRVLGNVTAYASARGFYRRGMIPTYLRMAMSPRARRNPSKCGYWYER